MSEFDPMAATATAENAAAPSQGAEVEGQGEQSGTEPAVGGEVASNPRTVPYERLQEVIGERNDLRTRYEPYAPVLEAARQAGMTPEQFASLLFNQQQAPVEPQADPFAEYLAAREIDPEYLTPGQFRAHQEDFQLRQQMQGLMQANQQQQQQAHRQQFEYGLRQAVEAHPMLKGDPELGHVLAAASYAQDATGKLTPQVAATLSAAVERIVNARMAEYQAGKVQDGRVPVVAGGSAPAPTAPQVDYHRLTDAEREARMESYLGALHRTP